MGRCKNSREEGGRVLKQKVPSFFSHRDINKNKSRAEARRRREALAD